MKTTIKTGDKVKANGNYFPLGGTVINTYTKKNNPDEEFYNWLEDDDFDVEFLVIKNDRGEFNVQAEDYIAA